MQEYHYVICVSTLFLLYRKTDVLGIDCNTNDEHNYHLYVAVREPLKKGNGDWLNLFYMCSLSNHFIALEVANTETNDMRLVRILIEAAKCGDTLNWKKKKYIERLWIVICFQNTTFKCISLLCKKCNYTLFKSWNSREIIYKNEQKDSLWVIIIIISHRWHRNHFTRWKNELIKHLLS